MFYTVWKSKHFIKIQNEKEFRGQSIKTRSIAFSLYWTLHETESAIERAIKSNTD